MRESNGSTAQSSAPDFNGLLQEAQTSGDFSVIIETAKRSHKMLIDFRDAILEANFAGKLSPQVAMGLNFLENLIGNAGAQLVALKQSEKETQAALKASAASPAEATNG